MGLKRAAHGDISRSNVSGAPTASDTAPSKKPKFDRRNPSTLAGDVPEEDAILDLDEIGRGGLQAKRNAVRLEGYDSDSSAENFDTRAADRARTNRQADKDAKSKDEDEADMFADIEEERHPDEDEDEEARAGKKKKEVRFLDEREIEGQVGSSTAGGHVSADFSIGHTGRTAERAESSSDESEGGDERRDALGSDVDAELGAGAKKKHAPRLDAFNMKHEQDEGRFDEAGNFVRNAKDPFEVHDAWLDGNSSKAAMRRAAQAQEDRERERRERDVRDDKMGTGELLAGLLRGLEEGETVLEALQRLGRGRERRKAGFKKNRRKDEMDVDAAHADGAADPAEGKRKAAVEALTSAADALLTRGQVDVYDTERALLERQYRRETGEAWVDRTPPDGEEASGGVERDAGKQWQYRWADARDGGQIHGPYDGAMMKAWNDAEYFGDGVEFRQVGLEQWSRSVDFV